MKTKPTIVCLCGSARFKLAFEEANAEATMQGFIVLAPGVFGHLLGLDLPEERKEALDELHRRKIDLADEVWVVSPTDYAGDSIRSEIEYAKSINKPVLYWPKDCNVKTDENQTVR